MRGSCALLPDIKVKPPGSTTPADVFNTVPLVEEGCQEGVLVCTCMDTDVEEQEGVDCVVQGRLDMVNAGLMRSCRDTDRYNNSVANLHHLPLRFTTGCCD